jgi:hypothetical protein
MVYCPECNQELPDGLTECYACGCDLSEDEDTSWVVLGSIEDKLYADYAYESLKAFGIPALVLSKEGFFSSIGLRLCSFSYTYSAPFEILVPAVYEEEAVEILDMIINKKWRRKEH